VPAGPRSPGAPKVPADRREPSPPRWRLPDCWPRLLAAPAVDRRSRPSVRRRAARRPAAGPARSSRAARSSASSRSVRLQYAVDTRLRHADPVGDVRAVCHHTLGVYKVDCSHSTSRLVVVSDHSYSRSHPLPWWKLGVDKQWRVVFYSRIGQKEWQNKFQGPKGQLRHHISARKIAAQTNSRTTLPDYTNRLPNFLRRTTKQRPAVSTNLRPRAPGAGASCILCNFAPVGAACPR
jgi:hypothetical protein